MTRFFSVVIIFLITCLLGNRYQVHSQNFSWAKAIGGMSHDHGTAAVTDASGNIYVTGMFRHTADFDPGNGVFTMYTTGHSDVFIMKLDASGNLVWANQVGSSADDNATSIALDATWNIVVTGFYQDSNDFDPGPGTYSLPASHNAFVLKLDNNGNFLWASSLGGAQYDYSYSIAIDNNNDIITTGYFTDSADADPGAAVYNLNANGYRDVFIQKLSPAGNLVWAKSLGGTAYDIGYSVTTDNSSNVYVTGTFRNTVDFDPGPGVYTMTGSGVYDTFILKLDASGNFQWVKQIGGTDEVISSDIELDNAGNILITGYFEMSADFDPGNGAYNMTSNGLRDAFVLKLDDQGDFLWAHQTGGVGHDWGNTLAISNSGSIHVTGVFRDTVDFDPGPGIHLQYGGYFTQIFIHTLHHDGTFNRVGHMGGSSYNNGFSCLDAAGNIITTGSFGDSTDFDMGWNTFIMNTFTPTQPDIFIHKMDSSGFVGLLFPYPDSLSFIYPNPVTDQLHLHVTHDHEAIVTLYDATSKNLLRRTFRKTIRIPVMHLGCGMYFYEIIHPGGYRSGGKFIKE